MQVSHFFKYKKFEKTALFEFGRYNSNNKFKHFENWPRMSTY